MIGKLVLVYKSKLYNRRFATVRAGCFFRNDGLFNVIKECLEEDSGLKDRTLLSVDDIMELVDDIMVAPSLPLWPTSLWSL